MADIVNLRQVRKRKARDEKDANAAQNRANFGSTKVERRLSDAKKTSDAKHLDQHKRDDAADDS